MVEAVEAVVEAGVLAVAGPVLVEAGLAAMPVGLVPRRGRWAEATMLHELRITITVWVVARVATTIPTLTMVAVAEATEVVGRTEADAEVVGVDTVAGAVAGVMGVTVVHTPATGDTDIPVPLRAIPARMLRSATAVMPAVNPV